MRNVVGVDLFLLAVVESLYDGGDWLSRERKNQNKSDELKSSDEMLERVLPQESNRVSKGMEK